VSVLTFKRERRCARKGRKEQGKALPVPAWGSKNGRFAILLTWILEWRTAGWLPEGISALGTADRHFTAITRLRLRYSGRDRAVAEIPAERPVKAY